MGGFSVWHWLILGIIVLLLFGKGRFSDMMGDVAKGIKSFKKGMSDDEEAEAERKAEAQRRLTADRPLDRPAERPIDLPPEPSRAADPLDRREP